jgi:hypothetical protein
VKSAVVDSLVFGGWVGSFSEFLAISDSGPQRFYRLWLLMGEWGLSELL